MGECTTCSMGFALATRTQTHRVNVARRTNSGRKVVHVPVAHEIDAPASMNRIRVLHWPLDGTDLRQFRDLGFAETPSAQGCGAVRTHRRSLNLGNRS